MDLDDFLEVELSTIPQDDDVESDTRSDVSNDDSLDSDAANNSSEAIMRAVTQEIPGENSYVNTLSEYGPAGMAAATAILSSARRDSSKKRQFETNPAIRRRIQTRLLRKIRTLCHEYSARVGQQAVFVAASPAEHGDPETETFKVVGSSPFDTVIRGNRLSLMAQLNAKLTEVAPPQKISDKVRTVVDGEETVENTQNSHPIQEDVVDLPYLSANGVPVALTDMTQAMLRNFIPVMLKHATGRGKPGWGIPSLKPVWWPEVMVPWASVRSDTRTEEQKQRHSWTYVLKEVVEACYKYHHQEHKLTPFPEPTDPGCRQPEAHASQSTHLLSARSIGPADGSGMNVDLSQTVSVIGSFQMAEPLLTDLNGALNL